MQALLDDPMVQAGFAPFLGALLVGGALSMSRAAWLAIIAGVATTLALSAGIGFTPLSASRKVVLLVLLAPAVGLALDMLDRPLKLLGPALAAAFGAASIWVFQSVLAQREGPEAWLLGAGVALFVALLTGFTLRLRDDGAAAGAATLGLGLAVGIAAILSASLGNMMNGIALAASGGALLLLQFVLARPIAPGWTGVLTVGSAASLFAAATFVLAELPWTALVTLPVVPLVAGLPLLARRPLRQRLVLLGVLCVLAASATVLAAWLATRSVAP
jgi:hypothetical protein